MPSHLAETLTTIQPVWLEQLPPSILVVIAAVALFRDVLRLVGLIVALRRANRRSVATIFAAYMGARRGHRAPR
jgi:hypothetical protein